MLFLRDLLLCLFELIYLGVEVVNYVHDMLVRIQSFPAIYFLQFIL